MKSATCYSAGDASHSTDRNGGCCWRGGATKSRLSQAMPAKTIQSGGGQVLSHCSRLPPTGKLTCAHIAHYLNSPHIIYISYLRLCFANSPREVWAAITRPASSPLI